MIIVGVISPMMDVLLIIIVFPTTERHGHIIKLRWHKQQTTIKSLDQGLVLLVAPRHKILVERREMTPNAFWFNYFPKLAFWVK